MAGEADLEALQERLRHAEETLEALHHGEVDALVVQSADGPKIYALESADAPYRILVERMQEAALTISRHGDVLYCNPRLRDLMQATDQQIVGRSLSELVAPEDRSMVLNLIEEAAGGRARAECRVQRRDGARVPVQIALSALVTQDFQGLCAIVTDLSDHYRGQEIAHSERVNRAILDQASDAMLLCDSTGRIRRANQAAIAFFGESCVGRPFEAVCSGLPQRLAGMPRGEDLRGVPIAHRSAAGDDLDLLVSAKRLATDASDEPVWMVTLTDITLIKRAERTLREADRRKDEFLAMLAHELRNPLAPIRSAVGVMERIQVADPTYSWGLQMINRQVDHMVRLVDDLLDVSRLTHGKIGLKMSRVNLAVLVERAIETSRPGIESRRHRMHVALPAKAVYLECDPVRIAQVISNLLNNAAKFTPPGGTISLAAEASDTHVTVCVKDSGIGISPEQLHTVFDLFAQADQSLERSEGGLGIGLTLVYRLVEAHGGSVAAFSAGLGQGSRFTVRLPLARAGSAPSVAGAGGDAVRTPTYRVLIVDDNADSCEALQMLLEMLGHEVRKALDGPAALELTRTFSPHLVLCDLGLPGMDGYEVVQRLRADAGEHQPVVAAITGYGQDEDRRRTQGAGFDHHLVKPVDWKAIESLIESLAPHTVSAY
jgi:PAS domain S-box-containing protein